MSKQLSPQAEIKALQTQNRTLIDENLKGWNEVNRLRKFIVDRWEACPDCGLPLAEQGCGHDTGGGGYGPK